MYGVRVTLHRRSATAAVLAALLWAGAAGCEPLDRDATEPADVVAGGDSFLVDLRPPQQFAQRHYRGSVNLQWGYGQFSLRVARLFPPASALRILGPDADEVHAAVAAAGAAGFEASGEVLDPAAADSGELSTQRTMSSSDLKKRLGAGEITVIDARTAREYAEGHIRGAVFVYPDDVAMLTPVLRADRPLAVICAAGWRSSMVTSWLERAGLEEVYNVIGGMEEWRTAGYPIEKGSQQIDFK